MNSKSETGFETESKLDPKLGKVLQDLRHSELRQPLVAARARSAFLAEASRYNSSVSNTLHSRLHKWKDALQNYWIVSRKEKKIMFNFMMTILIVLSVAFGGGAVSVAAAQGALPDDVLYPVKTWSEQIRLGWETDPQGKFELALQFAARRAEEIQSMLMAKGIVPEPVIARFANQQQFALQMAANLPDHLAQAALLRIQEQARLQEQRMAQLQIHDPIAEQIRTRVRTMLMTMAQLAQTGSADPILLREQLRNQEQNHFQTGIEQADPPGQEESPANGDGNPWTDEEPIPNSSYGPGEPQNPWTDEEPVPGSSYGPGDCEGTDCEPQNQNENPQQSGPNPDPGPGGQQNPDPNDSPGNNQNGNKP